MLLAAMTSVSVAMAYATACAVAACISSALLFILFLQMPRFSISLPLRSEVSSFFGFRKGLRGGLWGCGRVCSEDRDGFVVSGNAGYVVFVVEGGRGKGK